MKDLPHDMAREAPRALQQHPSYLRCVQHIGGEGDRVTDLTGDEITMLTRRVGPLCLKWVPRAPAWTPAFDAQPGVLLATPDNAALAQTFCAAGFRPLLTPQYVAELDLTLPQEARRAALHGKWRNRLCRAEASPLRVTHRSIEIGRDAHLLQLEAVQRRRRRYRSLPHAFTQAWAKLSPQATRLFVAETGNGPAAFMLFLLHGSSATYHLGWSGLEGRKTDAHTLILWHACNWLCQHGIQRLDLGSVDTETAPGLARFKIGAGATIRPLGPTMLRLPRPFRRIYRAG